MPRHLVLNDLLNLTGFSALYGPQFDVTADGGKLAFCAFEGPRIPRTQPLFFLAGGERGRLFITQAFGAVALQIDLPERHGVFSPVWSPDGRYIALALTDGVGTYPAVYDTEAGDLTQCCDHQLALRSCQKQFQWVGAGKLSFVALPIGQTPNAMTVQTNAMDRVTAMWPIARTASGATAMVFDTTVEPDNDPGRVVLTYDLESKALAGPGHADEKDLQAFSDALSSDYPSKSVDKTCFTLLPGTLEYEDAAYGIEVVLCRNNTGTQVLWRKGDAHFQVAAFDQHLQEVSMPAITRTPYGPLTEAAPLQKITTYPSETKQPVVINIYPDEQVHPKAQEHETVNADELMYVSVLAASGLTLVEPACPLGRSEGRVADLMADMIRSVDQIVTGLIDAGIATPGNIHLYGHSWGGWAVPMLLAETDHFASGVASAGIYDLAGFHLQNDARTRFDPAPRPCLSPDFLETEFGLSRAHWDDHASYARLSPVYHANQINAPLLMLHGDLDYVPVTGAEAMLNAMRLAGKDAQLVRYGGEDHVLSNPHNIADYYSRIADFIKEHAK